MKTKDLDEKQKFSTYMQRWASSAYRNFYFNHGLWVVINAILLVANLAQSVYGFVDKDFIDKNIVLALLHLTVSFVIAYVIVFVQMDNILKCRKARKKLAEQFKSIVLVSPVYDTKNGAYWYKLIYVPEDDPVVIERRMKSDKYVSLSNMRSDLKWSIRSMIVRGYEPLMLPWQYISPQF